MPLLVRFLAPFKGNPFAQDIRTLIEHYALLGPESRARLMGEAVRLSSDHGAGNLKDEMLRELGAVATHPVTAPLGETKGDHKRLLRHSGGSLGPRPRLSLREYLDLFLHDPLETDARWWRRPKLGYANERHGWERNKWGLMRN